MFYVQLLHATITRETTALFWYLFLYFEVSGSQCGRLTICRRTINLSSRNISCFLVLNNIVATLNVEFLTVFLMGCSGLNRRNSTTRNLATAEADVNPTSTA